MTFTDTEKLVFNKAIDICLRDANTSVKELSKKLKLNVKSVKGVIGSLVKKGVIAVDKEERGSTYVIVGRKIKMALTIFITVYPIVNNEQMSYGLDKYTKEQAEAFKLK